MSDEHEECSLCDGEGMVSCENCDGTGYIDFNDDDSPKPVTQFELEQRGQMRLDGR